MAHAVAGLGECARELVAWALICSFAAPPDGLPADSLERQSQSRRAPLAAWLQRVALEPWHRWDVEDFLKIATRGDAASDGTSSFHPLYSLLGRAVNW